MFGRLPASEPISYHEVFQIFASKRRHSSKVGASCPMLVKLLIIQFGNYAEAEHRFARGGDETYYAQRYTVRFVAELVRKGNQIRVMTIAEDAPVEELPSGVESLGVRMYLGRFRRPATGAVIRTAEAWQPTHVILQSPVAQILRWAVRSRLEILPMFADSFRRRGLRARLSYRRLATVLNEPAIRWVVNHGRNAAEDLVRIGVEPRKVLPFDWPSLVSPSGLPPKKTPVDSSAVRLTYAGRVTSSKGVGDLIEAVAVARSKGKHYLATIMGDGDVHTFELLARRLGVDRQIEFTGPVSHERVQRLMNEGDVVIVPSRWEYPEGLPQTIYEGLASRSPVVVSDHPMFAGRVAHRKSCMVFRASNPESLFEVIDELVSDGALYERLSRNADQICLNFHEPLKWDQVISRWLSASTEDDAWLRRFALAQ